MATTQAEREDAVPEYTAILRWFRGLLERRKREPVYCCDCAHVRIGTAPILSQPQSWRCAAHTFNPRPFVSHDGERALDFCSFRNMEGKCPAYEPQTSIAGGGYRVAQEAEVG